MVGATSSEGFLVSYEAKYTFFETSRAVSPYWLESFDNVRKPACYQIHAGWCCLSFVSCGGSDQLTTDAITITRSRSSSAYVIKLRTRKCCFRRWTRTFAGSGSDDNVRIARNVVAEDVLRNAYNSPVRMLHVGHIHSSWTNNARRRPRNCEYDISTMITFRVSRRPREMYCSHARLCVCLSAAACLHYYTDPDVTWRSGRGCPLAVHYWADLQSVHGLRCYGNTMEMHGRSQW